LPEPASWVLAVPDGAVVRVKVVPGASRPGIAGLHGDMLRVRVAAPPRGGAANRELLHLLASLLGVRPAALSVAAGARGREKRVHVRGLPAPTVRARLAAGLSVDKETGHN
jgi:hypothetical protein